MGFNSISLSELIGLPPPRSNFSHTHIPHKECNLFGEVFESYVGILLKLQHKNNVVKTSDMEEENDKVNFYFDAKRPDYVLFNNERVEELIEVKGGRTPSKGFNQLMYLSNMDIPLKLIYYPSDRNASSVVNRLSKKGVNVNATSFQDLPFASFFKGTKLHNLMADKKKYDRYVTNNDPAELENYVNLLYTHVSSLNSFDLVEIADMMNTPNNQYLLTPPK